MPRITKKRNYRKRVIKNSYRKRRVHIGGARPSVRVDLKKTGNPLINLNKELQIVLQKRFPTGTTSVVRNKSTRQSINPQIISKRQLTPQEKWELRQGQKSQRASPGRATPRASVLSQHNLARALTSEFTSKYGNKSQQKSTNQNPKPIPRKLNFNPSKLQKLMAKRQQDLSQSRKVKISKRTTSRISSQRGKNGMKPRKRPCYSYKTKNLCENDDCIFDNGNCRKK